jgi:hypothetical protein
MWQLIDTAPKMKNIQMPDTVERLLAWDGLALFPVGADDLVELKAEIERLRGERAGDQQRLFHYEAEIERLRAKSSARIKRDDHA